MSSNTIPETATYVGDTRFNDRLSDYSAAETRRVRRPMPEQQLKLLGKDSR
jgi:hypothetical protein